MDKPTPPKTITTRMLGTGPEVEFVFLTDAIAHGEDMAAWGAAQERKRAEDLLASAEAEPYATARLVNARRAYRHAAQ